MNFKNKYIKLLLLGLSAVAPAIGMQSDRLTQTMQHLVNNPKAVDVAQKFVAKDDRMTVASQVQAKEEELHNDYYTFVHAHNAAYYFPLKIYTFLWQLRKQRELKDFIFPHAVTLVESKKDIEAEEAERIYLLEHGDRSGLGGSYSDKLLSMNYAFFGNVTKIGSSSSYRITVGAGIRSFVTDSYTNPFEIFKCQAIYNKFKNEIESLATDYNKKSNSGNALFIAIPKSHIDECVFPASVAGFKRSVFIKGVGHTSDMKIIMETLRNNPEKVRSTDRLEFCLIMTQKKGGLDPDSGIKVFPIHSGDPAKVAELAKKEDILFAKIKAEIEQQEKQALNRVQVIANHVVQSAQADKVVPAQAMGRMQKIVNHLAPK